MIINPTNAINSGVYDLTNEEYHRGPGVSRSDLMEFRKTPYHYWHRKKNPEIEEPISIVRKSSAKAFGNALHAFILEPEVFSQDYHVMPKVNLTTKIGKQIFEEADKESNGRLLICEEAYNVICNIYESVKMNNDAFELISGALYEKSIFWKDPSTDLLCKARPDIWHSNFIGDLKTCVSASYRDFQKACIGYGYHLQAAMISESIKHTCGDIIKTFIYIAIEKEPPYAVAVYELDEVALSHGISQMRKTLQDMKECIEKNNWPSYPSAIMCLPSYAYII